MKHSGAANSTGGGVFPEPGFIEVIKKGKGEKVPLTFRKDLFREVKYRAVVEAVLVEKPGAGFRFRKLVIIHFKDS